MQIAQIVPKTRTQREDIFDYAIPPELLAQIRPGILVEIPFHGRKLEGVIINLKRKSDVRKLKLISKIIDPQPVIDDIHLKLSQWMSDYYLESLGKTLFENIVPPAKRLLKKENLYTTFYARAEKVEKRKSDGKKYLIVGNFKTRLKFYKEAIQKTLKQNQSIIILVPDLTLIRFFQHHLNRPFVILHSKMTRTERWLAWQKIREEKAKIIIGSQSALFAPARNLGLIIIDQEENETYKNDRSPRFHAVKVAEKLSKLTAVNLLLGSITPSIESYFQALKNVYILKKANLSEHHQTTIVNMAGKFQTISPVLKEKIEENLAQHKKIILVLNRKGEGIKYACPDCRWTALCPKCGLPSVPQKDKLFCFRCEKNFPPPENCPQCQGVHLRSFGLGTKKLEKFVKDFWPQAQIIRIEDGTSLQLFNAKNHWDIAIVTSYGLKFNFPPIGLVGIIDADQGLNFPSFQASEKNFQILYKFLKIGERGIIQTNLENNQMIEALAKLDWENFFLNEIIIRKKYGFPPFIKLIRLLYKNEDEEKCRHYSEEIFQNLSKIIQEQKISNVLILGPAPAFFKKRRNYFRWQIIIKMPKNIRREKISPLMNSLKNLPKGWLVDVDPTDLL